MIYTGPQLDYSEMRRRGAEMARTLEEKKQREESGIWWSGDQPTAAETEAQIWKIYGDDEVAKNGAYSELDKEYDTPGSIFYNPYRKATNQSLIDDLARRGIDVSGGINDNFFQQYAAYQQFLSPSDLTGTPGKPDAKKGTNNQWIAYDLYQLQKDEATTKKAEAEWAQMQKEVSYWTEKGLTDNEIKAKIDMSKYSTLRGMDDDRKMGTYTPLNRQVNYSQDAIDGVIWAARNKGFSSGDYFQDAVYSKLGYGNLGHSSYSSMAQRTPGSAAYHPYKSGATNDNDRMILGRDSFDQDFFNTTTAILQNPDSEEAKAWARRYDREKPTQQAEAELAALQNKLNSITEITPKEGESVYEAALRLVDRYLEEGVAANDFARMSMLQKMDEERAKGQALDLNRTVDYRREDMAANLAARITREQRKAQQEAKAQAEATAQPEQQTTEPTTTEPTAEQPTTEATPAPEATATPEPRRETRPRGGDMTPTDLQPIEGEEQPAQTEQSVTEPQTQQETTTTDSEQKPLSQDEVDELLKWVEEVYPNAGVQGARTGRVASAAGTSAPAGRSRRGENLLQGKSIDDLQKIVNDENASAVERKKAEIQLGYIRGEITDENLNTYLAMTLDAYDGSLSFDGLYDALTAYYRGDKELTKAQQRAFDEINAYIPFIVNGLYRQDFASLSDINFLGQEVADFLNAASKGNAPVEDLVDATLELYSAYKMFQLAPESVATAEELEYSYYNNPYNQGAAEEDRITGGIGYYFKTHPDEADDLRAITERINSINAEHEAQEAEIARNQEAAERLSNRLVLDMVEEAIATGDTSKLTTEAIQQFDSIVGSDQYGTVKDLKDDAWAKENIYNKDNGLFSYDLGYSIESAYGNEFWDSSVAEAVMKLMEDHYLLHYREAKALGQTLEEFYAENPSKYVSPADLRESAENQYKKKFDSDVPEVAQDIKDGVGWLEAVRRGAVSGGYLFASGFVGFASDMIDSSEEVTRDNNLRAYTELYGANARFGYTQELTAYANSLPEDDLRRAQILSAIEESRTTGRDIMYYSFNLNREKLEDVRSGLMTNVEANAQYMQEHGTQSEQDWYRWISSAVNSTLGMTASAALSAIPGVGPLAATAIVFAPGSFDETYRQYKDSLGRERAALMGFASAAWETVSEQWELNKYLPGSSGLGDTLKKGFTDIISREGAKGFNKVMTAIGGFGTQLAGNTLEEQGQELMQGAGEAALQYLIAGDADAFVNFFDAENIKDTLVSTALTVGGNTVTTGAINGAANLTAKTLDRLANNAIDTAVAENAALYDAVKAGQDSTQAISEGMASGEVQAAPMTEEQAQAIVDEAMAGQTSLFDFVEDVEAAPAEAPAEATAEAPEGELPGQTSMFEGAEEEAPQTAPVDGEETATDNDAFADMAEMAAAEEEQAEPAPAPKEEAPTFPARRNRHPATQGGNMSLAESRARAARAARVAQQGIDTFTDGTKTPAERMQGLQTAAAGLEAGNNANAESGLAGPISGTYVAMANAYTEALQAGDTETANSIVAQMQADAAQRQAAQQAEQTVEQTTTAQTKKDDAARQVAQTIVQNPEVQHKMAQDIADQQTASAIAAWPDGIPNTQEAKSAKQALDDIDAELEVARAKAEAAAQKREAARQNAAQALQDAKNAPQDKRLVKRASSMKGVMTKAENLYLAAQDELQRLDQQRAVAEKKLNDIKDAEAERARSASAISAEAQVAATVAQASEALAAEAQAQADVEQEIAEQDAAEAAENAENEEAEGMADEDRQNAETLVEAPEEAPKAQPIVQNPDVQHQAVEVTDEQTAPAETAPTDEAPAAEPVQEESPAPTGEKATPELVKQEHKLLMLRNRLEAVLSMRTDENSATFALPTKGVNIEGQQNTITGQNHAARQIALEINELLEEMGYKPFNLTYADGVRLMSSDLSSYHFKTISENFANGDAIADRWNGKDAPQYNRQSNAQTARALSLAGTPYMIAELRNSKGMINGQAVMLLNPARMGYFRDAIVSHIRNGADIHLNVDGLTEDAQKMVTKVLNGLKNTGNLTFDGQTSIAIDQEAEQGIKDLMKKVRDANKVMPSGTDVVKFIQKHSGEKFSREAIDSMIERKGWMSSGDLKALENAMRSNPELAQWLNGLEGKDLQAIIQSVAASKLKDRDESEVLSVLRRHQDVTQRENWAQLRDNMLDSQQRANDKVLAQLLDNGKPAVQAYRANSLAAEAQPTNNGTNNNNALPQNSPLRVMQRLANDLGIGNYVPTKKGIPSRALGIYQAQADYIAVGSEHANDYRTLTHELGHAIQDLTGYRTPQSVVNWFSQQPLAQAYSPAEIESEAQAEFTRLYMTGNAAQIFGQGVVDVFETALKSAGLYDRVASAAEQFRSFVQASTENKIRANIVNYAQSDQNISELEALRRKGVDFTIAMVDDTAGMREIDNKLGLRNGGLSLRERGILAKFASKQAMHLITGDLRTMDGQPVDVSMKDAIGLKTTQELDDLAVYRTALMAIDRYKEAQAQLQSGTQPNVLSMTVFGNNVSIADLEALVKDYETNKKDIVAASNSLDGWWGEFMQTWMVDTHLITQEACDYLRAKWPHYTPTIRDIPGAKRSGTSIRTNDGYTLHKIHGSDLDIINPLETMQMIISQTVEAAHNNAIAGELYRASLMDGSGAFVREIAGDIDHQEVSASRFKTEIGRIMSGLHFSDADIQRVLGKVTGPITENNMTTHTDLPNTIVYTDEEGIRHILEVSNPELWESIQSATKSNISNARGIARSIGHMTRFMTRWTTGSNPKFALKNFVRDFQNSVNHGSWASNYITGLAKWAAAAYDVVTHKGNYDEYTSLGGGDFTRFATPKTYHEADTMLQNLADDYHRDTMLSKAGKVAGKAKNLLTLSGVNEIIEQTSRYAEYKWGKHDLSTPEGRQRAFLAAQEATTNFALSGNSQIAQDLRYIAPFWNATLQGTYQLKTTFDAENRDRLAPRIAKTVLNNALMGAMQYMLLTRMFGTPGRDDDKEWYDRLSQDIRLDNMILPFFDNETHARRFMRLPLAQSPYARMAFQLGYQIMNMGDGNALSVDLGSTAQHMLTGTLPTDTIFNPAISLLSNKNYYGGTIVPSYLEGLPASQQYVDTTPNVFKMAGRLTNVSPLKLQYLMEQYTGFIGQTLIPLTSPDNLTGEMDPGGNLYRSLLRDAWTIEPAYNNDVQNSYYTALDVLDQIQKGASSQGYSDILSNALSAEDAQLAVDTAKSLTSKGGALYKLSKDIADLRDQQKKAMEAVGDHDSKEKIRKMYQQEIIAKEQEALAYYNDYAEKYITGRNFVGYLLNGGAKAGKASPLATYSMQFQYDKDETYMKRAQEVYDANGKSSALPHPNTSPQINKVYYHPDTQECWEEYQGQYRQAYKEVLDGVTDSEWSAMDQDEKENLLSRAHTAGNTQAKRWYLEWLEKMNLLEEN